MALIVWLVALAAYLPKVTNHFTFDDRVFIQDDPSLRSLDGALGEFGRDQARLYRPLRSLVLAGMVAVFGVENPLPFHLAGMAFHATLAALVFGLVLLLLGDRRAAVAAGLVFAVHPVHADRVANITGSFDLLGMMLGYAAWYLAARYDQQRARAATLAAAVVALWLGCLASEEALMAWPLLLLGFFATDGDRKRRIHVVLAFTAVVVAHLVLRSWVLGGVGRTATYAAGSLGASILTMAVIVWRYVGLLFWPVGLTPAYGPQVHTSVDAAVLAGLVGLAVLVGVGLAARRRAPGVTLAVGWLLIGLAPFSNLLPGDTLMAERYLYSGLGGFAVLVGVLAQRAWVRPRVVVVLGAVLLSLYLVGTGSRCRVWGRPQVLWTQAAQREPSSFLANLNAGYHLLNRNEYGEAMAYATRARALEPDRAEPLLMLGEAAVRQGRATEGVGHFEDAVTVDPEFCPAFSALAQGLIMAGRHDEAGQAAQRAIRCDPGETQAHYVLAYLFVVSGRCDLAQPHLAMILNSQPRPQEYRPALELAGQCVK